MTIERERADFEAWFTKATGCVSAPKDIFVQTVRDVAWSAWQARAALQSQDLPNRQGGIMDKLFCDLKTDEEKAAFFFSGRGHETGVVSQSIQNDVAMAYHRCVKYKKEIEALQSQDREDAERYRWLRQQRSITDLACVTWNTGHDWVQMNGAELDAAIDYARRAREGGW